MEYLLEARGITKRYGGAVALDGASFSLRSGEVHALMGENGAGKSTLSRILAGVARPDAGELMLKGVPVRFNSPQDAQDAGIAIVFQELDLFPNLSVAENIAIGNRHAPAGASSARTLAFCSPFLEQVGLKVRGTAPVGTLPIAQQQLVAIARGLSMNARVVILDEPTSSLTGEAVERLFLLIDRLTKSGAGIVYVSHKMNEIDRICDRMTVLRDGSTVGTRNQPETSMDELIAMMVGRELSRSDRKRPIPLEEELLRVEDLRTRKLRGVSFALRRGEVLGLAGLVGSGRSEVGAALFGLVRITGGRVWLKGKPLELQGVWDAIRSRIGLVPEDRKTEGLMMQLSVAENITLSSMRSMQRFGAVSHSREEKAVKELLYQLKLKCASPDQPVGTLSGGNQQKALLARWLLVDPEVLFLDDPARGIDVGAKEDIYGLISKLAGQGKGILLASSELSELFRCCHRILVLHEGKGTGLLDTEATTQEEIMLAATGLAADAPTGTIARI